MKLLAIMLICILLTSSCWSRREIESLGIVLGMGISKTEEGLYTVVAQVANPGAIVAENPEGRDVYTIMISEGLSVFDALRNIARLAKRRLYIAHIQVFIIDEAIAKEGLGQVMGFFVQVMEIRMEPFVFISKLPPKEILDTPNSLGLVPSLGLNILARGYGTTSKYYVSNLLKTVEATNNPIINYVTTLVEKLPPATNEELPFLKLTQLAVFKDQRLVGYLDEEGGQAYNFISNNFKNGLITYECGNTGDQYVIEVLSSKAKIHPIYTDERIGFDIELKVEGSIAERISSMYTKVPIDIEKVERQLSQTIEDKLTKTIALAQEEYHVDIFNLSRNFSIKHPQKFKEIKDQWNEEFSRSDISVKVEATITHSALNVNRGRL
ncbi:Ger(x)C family spore germination protein [Alkaliphilus serpentinus]|uniref:Ger(x)C family spore germination protein n=1 Tax=Alkaliphilus serpentinus TaxID=1482731 RepID=UPI001FAA6EBF|nr:Ger(x)C family spore germination protein [Alkaliphilus serpentinus]